MKYRLIIFDARVWQRDCDSIEKKDLKRIVERIQLLEPRPLLEQLDIKKLQDYDSADFRMRVGNYRVLFNKDDQAGEIFLLRVLHRSKLY